MKIEIHDAALEARIHKQIQATGVGNPEAVVRRLLETQEEQDRWLEKELEPIRAKIRRGLAELDAGRGIPEDRLDAHMANLKSRL